MEAFPCPRERTAASALLLLSTKPSSSSSSSSSNLCLDVKESLNLGSKSKSSKGESLVLSDSKSCSSSLTSDDSSSEAIQAHRLRLVAVVARCHEMKLKVVRKSRSKTYRSSDCRKITSGKPLMMMAPGSASETTEAASCLSRGSSAISSARSYFVNRSGIGKKVDVLMRKQVGSAYMHRRAEAILRLLSHGCATEVRIRQLLGDSPDTSKALRMLLKLEEVKRSGAGGRLDPYIYTRA